MQEILPDIFHWTALHEDVHEDVHSTYIAATDPAVLIDPMLPKEGIDWFKAHNPPAHIFLTNRLHYRHSGEYAASFGASVWCHKDGLHEFSEGEGVLPFQHGDVLPGGILALKIGVLCPEETALYIPHSGGILAVADAIVRYDGDLGFVPDYLLGENPEAIKRGLRDVFLGHLDRDFDNMLFAHGDPWVGGAKAGLRNFLDGLRL